MISETTIDAIGKKTIMMKSADHEKSVVSVGLTAKAYGCKLKATREVSTLQLLLSNRKTVG